MSNSLYELLRKCKTRNSKYVLELIKKFNPLIKKYSYSLNYDDAEQDLIVALIEIVISFHQIKFQMNVLIDILYLIFIPA